MKRFATKTIIYFLLLVQAVAINSCKSDNKLSEKEGEQTSKDSISITQLITQSKNNKDSSIFYINKAATIVKQRPSTRLQAIYWALLGKELFYSSLLDSANSIADQGLQLPYNENEGGLKGKFYNLKGNVAGFKKQPHQSIEYYILAEQLFEKANDSAALAGIYSNIANTYFSLKDYESAHLYATKAYNLISTVKEINIINNITITFALSLNKVGRNLEALPMVRIADSIAATTGNKMAKITATIGYAEVYKSMALYDSAAMYYKKCIQLSKELGLKHYELISQVGLMGLYEEENNPTAIIDLYPPAIALAEQLQNVDVLHTANRIAGKAYGKIGQYQKGFELLSASYALYDSVAGIENQRNINELLVKYNAERNEKEILNKNLLLAQQKVTLGNRQTAIIILVSSLLILSLVIFYVKRLNNERVKRLESEKIIKINDAYINGEQRERTRHALDIHDGIASTLTGIIYKLQGGDTKNTAIISLLQTLHEDTRRIAHNLLPVDFEKQTLNEALAKYCLRMSTPQIEVVYSSDANDLDWELQRCLLYYRIFQELINNALKYANCKTIFAYLQSSGQTTMIKVEDDGKGIDLSIIENGFRSIKERIKPVQGILSVVSQINEGTTITITFDHE